MKTQSLLTPQEVRDEFLRKGQSIGTWADKNGFSRPTVTQVLNGRNAGTRGTGHKIAVMLGIKAGEIIEESSHG